MRLTSFPRALAALVPLFLVLFLGTAATATAVSAAPPPAIQADSQGEAGNAPAASDGESAEDEGADAEPNEASSLEKSVSKGLDDLMRDPIGTLKHWIVDYGPGILGRIVLFFVLLALSRILANFAARVTRRALDRTAKNATGLLKNFIENTVSKVVFFVGLVLALQNIGLDIAPLLAGIGVLGFVVGFALQDTLGNFAAGVMLLLYRPFDIGDYVEVAGKEGTVESMTLVSTTMSTLDNQQLTVPNGKIWGDVIRNVTANPKRRIMETIGIGYDDDIDHATKVALETIEGMEKVESDPAPQVMLVGLGDSSVNLSVRAWVPTGDYFGTLCEFRRRVKMRFDAEGISIPYPQRDVHLYREAQPEEPKVAATRRDQGPAQDVDEGDEPERDA